MGAELLRDAIRHLPPQMLLAVLRGGRRSFRDDARAMVSRLKPPPQILGREHIPSAGPCLLTVNHYHSSTFQSWWIALAISAALPVDVHWITAGALTFPDALRSAIFTPLSQRGLRRIADTYGFTPMPPMPPRPFEAAARAQAVRRVLKYVRENEKPIIGLAPEGGDTPGGAIQLPPPGVGRFILHLAELGLPIAPIGAYEENGSYYFRFGARYCLKVEEGLPPDDRDRLAAEIVMRRIAELLPVELRGEFNRRFQ